MSNVPTKAKNLGKTIITICYYQLGYYHNFIIIWIFLVIH